MNGCGRRWKGRFLLIGGWFLIVLLSGGLASGFTATPVLADPPPWAPAHGHRAKDKHGHKGKDKDVIVVSPVLYTLPTGIERGHCDRGIISKALLGGTIGGAVGGLAGSRIGSGSGQKAAVIGGVLIGTLVGTSIGRSMDVIDHACIAQALERAPGNRTVVWQNPETGGAYTVVPHRTYEATPAKYCREYQATAEIGGRVETMIGTACRQPDGSWKLGG